MVTPATGQNSAVKVSRMVTSIAARRGGGHAVMTQNGLELLDMETGALTPVVDPEESIESNRFNDAKCDRRGRFWAGSMALDASAPSGSLYCIEPDGTYRRVDTGFTVSNGMDWSPDDKSMYFADSAQGCVFVYDFDLERATVSNRRPLITIPAVEGKPDGLTVDAEGVIWVAVWDGWSVRRYAPDGRLDRIVVVPVPRPSSCCFGGPISTGSILPRAEFALPSVCWSKRRCRVGCLSLSRACAASRAGSLRDEYQPLSEPEGQVGSGDGRGVRHRPGHGLRLCPAGCACWDCRP
ncbi:SMP-30/gluconolactonase/LRE family protein [Devosia sediminis]|uniref:SMP-30/gluconolactonase/LRE family protein n=1 Tax=Devosia sediminis TaxID=2798801 RepID=UPI001F1B0C98|nr:SMP-30/gluconolactonase/LRE family protein [Devosia sediminis]